MYRVDGSSDLKEEVLEHWEGYRGSRPVRIGNGAAGQLQLDIYGEAMDSIYFADQHGLPGRAPAAGWRSRRHAGLAVRQLGPARGGHLGDPRRAQGLHLRPADELGRARPRRSAWPPSTGGRRRWSGGGRSATRSTTRSWSGAGTPSAQAFVQHYDRPGARLLAAADVRGRVHRAARPDVGLDPGRDGRRAGHRQPGLPLRPGGLAGRAARLGGHVLAVHVRLRRRAGPAPAGWTRPGWSSRRCSPTPTTSACSPRRSR